MDKLIKYTILATVVGVILAFNMYHADYKLLIAQVGTIALAAMYVLAKTAQGAAATVAAPPYGAQRFALFGQHKMLLLQLLFLGVCVLSFLMSSHKLASWQELYKIVTWITFGMIVGAQFIAPEKQRAIINTWLLCAGIVAIYGILQFFGIDFMKFKLPGGRIVSTFGNATLLAGFLAMTIPVVFAKTLGRKKATSYQLSSISYKL